MPPPAKKTKLLASDLDLDFDPKFNDIQADVILRCMSSDSDVAPARPLFAVRRSVLACASSVFEDMFGLPQAIEQYRNEDDRNGRRFAHQKAPGVLPVVEVTDDPQYLALVLGLIHRPLVLETVSELSKDNCHWTVEDIIEGMAIADKYDVPSAMALLTLSLETIAAEPCGPLEDEDHKFYLATLAGRIIFKLPGVVDRALTTWWDASAARKSDERPPPFHEIEERLFVKVPVKAIQVVLGLERSLDDKDTVADGRAEWVGCAKQELDKFLK